MAAARTRYPAPVGRLSLVAVLIPIGMLLPADAAPPSSLPAALRAELAQLPHSGAQGSACVVDLHSGHTVFTLHADLPLIPASSAKVFVLAAALKVLGPGFEFRTRLATDGVNLFLVGDGDPALGDPRIHRRAGQRITADFEHWAATLHAAGYCSFAGDLLIDESLFDDVRLHPDWDPADLGKWFAAPVGALNFNDNCVDITLIPGANPGLPVQVACEPLCPLIEIVNRCRTGTPNRAYLHHPPDTFTYEITGTCAKRWPFGAVAFPDPGLLTAETLRDAFTRGGVQVAGKTRRARVRLADNSLPGTLTLLAVRVTPLADVLARAGKNSQNLFAECLWKRTGYAWSHRQGHGDPIGSWESGRVAVRDVLRTAGVDTKGMVLADGSGLGRTNRCTARQLAAVLAWMHTQPEGRVLQDSLSVAGVDGSLHKQLADLPGRVRGKTGTMRGVRTLGGYVYEGQTPRYAFAFMFNGYQGPSTPYREIQERCCRALIAATDVPGRTR